MKINIQVLKNSIIFGDFPLSKKYEAIEITVNIPIRLSSSVNTFHNTLAGLTLEMFEYIGKKELPD